MNSEVKRNCILIVDDNPINIQLLGDGLKNDYDIRFATNGEDALKIANSETPPDMILLDILMPGMDGYEVCRQLKANGTTQDIPVIFITAKSGDENEMKGLEIGALDYIIKPFSIPIVKARVRNYISLKLKSDALERLTCIDGLTNISNRRRLDEFLKQEWDRGMRTQMMLSLIILDVDYFKKYNDNYGHAAGDKCLIRIATALEGTLSRATDFVARYGGEEFVAVLPDTNEKAAQALAEKMRAAVESLQITHEHSAVNSNVTISLGITTTIPSSCSSAEGLLKAADSALYKAKESGRNRSATIMH